VGGLALRRCRSRQGRVRAWIGGEDRLSGSLRDVCRRGQGHVQFLRGQRSQAVGRGGWGHLASRCQLDAARPAARGISPLAGLWIATAVLSGGGLPPTTQDGWQAHSREGGVVLVGPAAQSRTVADGEEVRAYGFSDDGTVFVLATPSSITLLTTANLTLHLLIFGRRHLTAVRTDYVDHHDAHRPHRTPSWAPTSRARETGHGLWLA
jgi:hypothetical protein